MDKLERYLKRLEELQQIVERDSEQIKRHLGEATDQIELIKIALKEQELQSSKTPELVFVPEPVQPSYTPAPSPLVANREEEVYVLPADDIPIDIPAPQATTPYAAPIQEPVQVHPVEQPRPTYATPRPTTTPNADQQPKEGSRLEAFIGGNLIGKLGILITLIGIFIGTRYAIEHELIGETMRIVLGYVAGAVLVGLGLKLKKNYLNYSAVLLGGGLATMYFVTYLAYNSYEIIPQIPAFLIMLLLTVVSILQSLKYNQVVVAHIGLVGAYAIPFLVSTGSSNYLVLFTYVAIINAGILVLSFKRYWKSLYYSAFVFTWLIYAAAWVGSSASDISVFMLFVVVFFLIFYATFLFYKLIKDEKFKVVDTMLLLSNAAIFFAFSYTLWDDTSLANHHALAPLTGAFIHFTAFLLVKRFQPSDRSIYYLTSGLAILFVTIAVPMELKAQSTSLFWAMEAALLLFIGCKKPDRVYQSIAASIAMVVILAWLNSGFLIGYTYGVMPVINVGMLVDLLVMLAFGAMVYLYKHHNRMQIKPYVLDVFYQWLVPIFLILGCWSMMNEQLGLVEIDTYGINGIIYILASSLYVVLLGWLNLKFFKSSPLNIFTIIATSAAILCLFTFGLYFLGSAYDYYSVVGGMHAYFIARYATLLVAVVSILMLSKTLRYEQFSIHQLAITSVAYLAGLVWASNEYLLWTDMAGFSAQGRLGLSIIWALYAIMLIVVGIKQKSHLLRISGIVLFGITLVKLFIFDLVNATVLTKTIVFTAIGAILLIVAYLYNRHKEVILGVKDQPVASSEPEEPTDSRKPIEERKQQEEKKSYGDEPIL